MREKAFTVKLSSTVHKLPVIVFVHIKGMTIRDANRNARDCLYQGHRWDVAETEQVLSQEMS